MTNPIGFMQFARVEVDHRPIQERIRDWHEIDRPLVAQTLNQQAARCMDCGIPFCHGAGCPVQNRIPEFNDLVHRQRWREAAENLHSTNNFPEITGRVCPAPCEASCSLAINTHPVSIKEIERSIIERAFREGWVEPRRVFRESGTHAGVIKSVQRVKLRNEALGVLAVFPGLWYNLVTGRYPGLRTGFLHRAVGCALFVFRQAVLE